MSVSAIITVTREDEDIDVELVGYPEYFGSHNPFERGVHIGDWHVESPDNLILTNDEAIRAEEALEEAIYD